MFLGISLYKPLNLNNHEISTLSIVNKIKDHSRMSFALTEHAMCLKKTKSTKLRCSRKYLSHSKVLHPTYPLGVALWRMIDDTTRIWPAKLAVPILSITKDITCGHETEGHY